MTIGNASVGNIDVTAAISRTASTAVNLVGAGDIVFTTGHVTTAGGNLNLSTSDGTGAAKPNFAGTDLTLGSGTVSGTGKLSFGIAGTTVDTQYQQLKVVGGADLTNISLALSGAYVPMIGESFTLIDNDGTDAVVGTFTGKAQGSTITFNGATLRISYTGGTGNDVVLTGLSQPPTFSGYSLSVPKNTMAVIGKAKLLARASDPDGGVPVISAVTAASAQGGVVTMLATAITYTPASGFTGSDSFQFTLGDGQGGSFLATVNVTVTPGSGVTQNRASLTVLPGGNVSLVFAGIPGQQYLVQRSVDLVTWTTLTTATAAADGLIPWTDTSPPPGTAFYRTAVPIDN